MPLVLPVDEAAWPFRLCLYVGLALLVLDVVLPRVFRRRLRLQWPWQWHRPRRLWLAVPMPADRFRRRKRELEAQIHALERDEPQVAKKKKKKKKTRVVLPGDTTETDGGDASERVRRRSTKRVSFDVAEETKSEASPVVETVRPMTPVAHVARMATLASPAEQENIPTTEDQVHTQAPVSVSVPSSPPPPATTTATSRHEPFSLFDVDLPWSKLPHYAHIAQAPALSPGPTLNVRRPFGNVNGASSVSTLLASGSGFNLALKHKIAWKRTPSKQPSPSPAKTEMARPSHSVFGAVSHPNAASAPPVQTNSFGSTSFNTTTHTEAASRVTDSPQLLFRPDHVLRPSPVPLQARNSSLSSNGLRMPPSPKPPLHPRPTPRPAPMTATSRISTPVAPQSRLRSGSSGRGLSGSGVADDFVLHRTPRIVRSITFDEDMMAALATPSDESPLITESTRKRQRESGVEDALLAVGLPYHKRRLND